jgi:phenylalanyl-tRNA synthetase beta chain
MRVPLTWLREHCSPDWTPEHLAERLAMTGTEVERVSLAGAPSADGFVVGRVLSAEKHPDADRLSVCEVDTGDGTRTIVCGAPNVAAGQLVGVALPGAVLADGTKLRKATLRGVASDGMIVSEAELEIGDDADGIMVLAPEGAELDGVSPGAPLSAVLPVSEPVLELEVTTNRPDCLSIYGVAREVHAISEAPLGPEPWAEDTEVRGKGTVGDYGSIEVEAPELCPRFTARAFTEVGVGPSPPWLKARLSAAGQRPINNVVDITNYAMLLTGQPLHAYDLDRVPDGALTVRRAADGETMTTLDGVERSFDTETVLVCDRNGPSGIGGIMGGQVSEVSEDTTRVLLEAATWNGVNILRTSRMLSLRSEASARFEKQLHPELAIRAQRVASRLLTELCGAALVPGTIDVHSGLPEPRVVSLRVPKVEALIGMPVDAGTCAARLRRLGFGVEGDAELLQVSVPPERDSDVQREADLIEEVARLGDLDRTLPSTLPAGGNRVGGLSRAQALQRRAEDALRDSGCDEVIAWSFDHPELDDRLRLPGDDPRRSRIEISNPLSEEMRTTLLGGLLDAARGNLARGAERVALFESGRVYLPGVPAAAAGPLAGEFAGERPAPALEPHRIGCLLSGLPLRGWRGEQAAPDFFAAKGLLEGLCAQLGVEVSLEPAGQPFLHPGRSARILLAPSRPHAQAGLGGEAEEPAPGSGPGEPASDAGWIGELHPLVARDWDLEGGAAFELSTAALVGASSAGRESYDEVATHPAALEDLAVIVPDSVSAAEVREAALAGGGELLASAEIFDLYRGEQVGEGHKSLALRFAFRAADRTLTDEEVAERREAIRAAVEAIGGSLRE